MDIIFKFNEQEEAKVLRDVVQNKFQSLEKFTAQANSVLVEVEFEKVAPKNNGHIFRFETNLTIDGDLHRAEATEESFEAAIDEVRDELDKKLRRNNKKQIDLARDGAREMKEALYA